MIRFHLDENVDHAVAQGLRLRGVDVTTTTDVDLIGATDIEQLSFAFRENRVIFTSPCKITGAGRPSGYPASARQDFGPSVAQMWRGLTPS